MGFLNFSKKTTKPVEIILDIGNNTVGGGIFERGQNGHATLLYSARESITQQGVLTGESLLNATTRSLDLVLVHLEKYGLRHFSSGTSTKYSIQKISIVISSPWHISECKTITFSSAKPSVVTQGLIESLILKEEKDFEDAHQVTKHHEAGIEILEKKIIKIQLNGYATSNPYGKNASSLELLICLSFSSKHVIKKIEQTVLKHFSHQKFEWHSFSLIAYAAIRDFFPAIENFLLVSVGGEITDITVIKAGVIAEQLSFPLGHNGLLKTLGRICEGHPKCSLEGLYTLHRDRKISTPDGKKVEKAIEEMKSSWLESFITSISSFSSEAFLPNIVFLFEDSPFISVFENFLKSADSSKLTLTSLPFDVKTMGEFGNAFKGALQPISGDISLSMEADFLMRSK
ncbi:MAG: hypothetical protein V4467_03985 [Patescibacteria group bacterium]